MIDEFFLFHNYFIRKLEIFISEIQIRRRLLFLLRSDIFLMFFDKNKIIHSSKPDD